VTTGQTDPRPRPQYGEYADETNEPAATDSAAGPAPAASSSASAPAPADSPQGGEHAGPVAGSQAQPQTPTTAQHPAQPPQGPAAQGSPRAQGSQHRLPGVPHNLGARTPAAAPTHAPSKASPDEPAPGSASAATPPPPAQPGEPYRAAGIPGAQQYAQPQPKGRRADRFITILLLALGAYGALNSGFAMMRLSTEVARIAEILGLEDFVVPSQVSTIGTVGAILMLALYALVLIFSFRRLRAQKLTFWAPLAAGALALLIYLALAIIAYVQSPELVQAMAQPDALRTMMEALETQGV